MKNSTSLENHSRAWRLRGERPRLLRSIHHRFRTHPAGYNKFIKEKGTARFTSRSEKGSNELISVQPVDPRPPFLQPRHVHRGVDKGDLLGGQAGHVLLLPRRIVIRIYERNDRGRVYINGMRKMVGTTRALVVSRVFGGVESRGLLAGEAFWFCLLVAVRIKVFPCFFDLNSRSSHEPIFVLREERFFSGFV